MYAYRSSFQGKFVPQLGKIIAISLAALFILSNTVLAANWVYLQRQEGTRYGPCTEYIDADTVIQADGRLTYWTLWVFDEKSDHHPIMKILRKKETLLTDDPLKHSILEMYHFDEANVEIKSYLKPMKDYDDINIIRILGYAKDTQPAATLQPDHVVTPKPRWYGSLPFDDGDLYWDIHSIIAWPQNNPAVIDIRIKQVWNQQGIDKRKAYLSTKKPYSMNKDNDVKSTILSCQVLVNQPQLRIREVTDYDSTDRRSTLLDGIDWHEIEPGSMEEAIRTIALNWLDGDDGQ